MWAVVLEKCNLGQQTVPGSMHTEQSICEIPWLVVEMVVVSNVGVNGGNMATKERRQPGVVMHIEPFLTQEFAARSRQYTPTAVSGWNVQVRGLATTMMVHSEVLGGNQTFVENALRQRIASSLRRASDNAGTGTTLLSRLLLACSLRLLLQHTLVAAALQSYFVVSVVDSVFLPSGL